uniref:Uncharacterized protein n=1 Tax=Nonomuraea gerenzanensis TaxID=93944 RepID=A0A1M4DVJ4_9ACTN|nr:hypothetical protein BN4615_P96 [Nonomuraea gerenzanensis]
MLGLTMLAGVRGYPSSDLRAFTNDSQKLAASVLSVDRLPVDPHRGIQLTKGWADQVLTPEHIVG